MEIESWALVAALRQSAAQSRGRQWLMKVHPRLFWLDPRWWRSPRVWLELEMRGW